MLLLNSKKILDCNENEESIHENEIITILDNIHKIHNIDCALIINDSFNNEPKITKCKLHDVFEYLEYFDNKNGIDIYQDDDFLTFILNGQTYIKDNESHIYFTSIKILPLDAYGNVCKIYIDRFI